MLGFRFIATHTFSLLDGLSKPHQIASRLIECGYAAGAITDHGSVAGAASIQTAFGDACKCCGHQNKSHSSTRCVIAGCKCAGFEKATLKAILGEEFYLCSQDASVKDASNRSLTHLCVLAKSQRGWKNLIRASNESQRPDFLYYKPRLNLDRLAAFSQGEFVVFSGHIGSDLAHVCFGDKWREAYSSPTYETARMFVRDDWKKAVVEAACRYRDLFGKENFWLEIQLIDQQNMPASTVVSRILRWVSTKTGIPCVATADSHYPRMEDARDQRVLLCSALKTTMGEVDRKLAANEDVTLGGFFKSKRYHIPSLDEMTANHPAAELAATVQIAEMCEEYVIAGKSIKPMMPKFPCSDGLSSDETMKRLCEEGWERRIASRIRDGRVWGERADSFGGEWSDPVSYTIEEYRDRLKNELGVIFEAGLSGYFLIVADYLRYARTKGKVGKGRGSAAGCLASYLTGITDVDPLVYNLIFERFYNAGRNSPGRVALPDIDSDFEKFKRDDVKQYIRNKYGTGRVADMATFTRMQGRGAITDVLHAHGAAQFEEIKRITEHLPSDASIADHLQEMLEERGESSIIRWTLENDGEGLRPWCHVNAEGVLDGPLAAHFEQAIRLEGTYRSSGRHPSGLIVSPVDLADVFPMSWDKSSGEMIVAVDMRDAEAMGGVKLDILGLAVLDKTRGARELIRTGRLVA